MKVSVFGLGYVGCVSAACLAKDGHQVVGVDANEFKVDLVAGGRSPVIEPRLEELIQAGVKSGDLRAIRDGAQAVRESDASVICVGTPSNGNGSLNLMFVEQVCREIGAALADKKSYHVVIVRSTMLPSTVQEKLIPILEANSGKRAGQDFGVALNPEFLREGSAIDDYYRPSFIVIGELDSRSGDAVQEMYARIDAPVIRTDIRTAEMVKYVSNTFHAVKVVFANEIGTLCKAHGIDGQQVMDLFCQDRRLNISPAYLRPGFAFGGSCLPKDLRALLYRAKERDLECPLLSATWQSNRRHIEQAIEMVESTGKKRVGVLGLSFKAGTDDVRESPIVPLVEMLVGRGYQVAVYDEKVELSRLIGANKSYLESVIPHIALLMRSSIADVVEQSDVVVLANGSSVFQEVPALLREDQVLVDLVGMAKDEPTRRGVYEGICW
jgi:GDP-mannose 6-dehydrogenase